VKTCTDFKTLAHLHVLLAGLLPAEARLREQRDVADSVHVRVAGLQPAVHLQRKASSHQPGACGAWSAVHQAVCHCSRFSSSKGLHQLPSLGFW
jgi:hypothetical protein